MDWILHDQFAAVAADASDAYQVTNKIAPPPHEEGETVTQYRLRICQGLQHASRWARTDISATANDPLALNLTEAQIFGDAMAAARRAPDLREIHKTDPRTGSSYSEFVGSKAAWMSAYKKPPQISPVYVDGVPCSPPCLP